MIPNILTMTDTELERLIFKGKDPWEFVTIPDWLSVQLVQMTWVERSLRDWAWQNLSEKYEND